jgi:dCTP deaminase
MILNTQELYDRIYGDKKGVDRLAVIPAPKKETFMEENGASIDLRLGRWFRTMKQSNLPLIRMRGKDIERPFTKEHFVRFDGEFIIHPGKFVLGITLEWITLPGDLAGHVTGKSSLGRRGLIIETAAGVQPGFAGCLTLEFANVGEIPIALQPGMSVCQVFFHQASSSNIKASSQFKGSRKPGLGVVAS